MKQTKQVEPLLPKEDLSQLPGYKQRFYKRFGYGFNFEPITNSIRLLEFIEEELAQDQQEAVERENAKNRMAVLGTLARLGYKGHLSDAQIKQLNGALSEALQKEQE